MNKIKSLNFTTNENKQLKKLADSLKENGIPIDLAWAYGDKISEQICGKVIMQFMAKRFGILDEARKTNTVGWFSEKQKLKEMSIEEAFKAGLNEKMESLLLKENKFTKKNMEQQNLER